MRKVLKAEFFDRSALKVAPDLLGKFLVRNIGRKEESHMITEVEAYEGEKDLACHASKGRTKRTDVMFGPPGHWYVYLIYGIHELLNIVTGPGKKPTAVLIRGVTGYRSPGVLTRELHIDRSLYGKPATRQSGLWIEDRGVVVRSREIVRSKRIGVTYAREWAEKPWRFVLSSSSAYESSEVH